MEMEITYSMHSLERMKEREISKNEVRNTIWAPTKIITKGPTNLAMRIRPNGHLLIVVYTFLIDTYKIITVIDTSKVNKYL